MDLITSRIKNKVNNIITNFAFQKIINIKSDIPIISFTFDDFPISAYKEGCKLLNEFNSKGTFYISLKFLNNTTLAGDGFSANNLNSLILDGHELGCHTFDHLDAAKDTPEEFMVSINKNQKALDEVLELNYILNNFAYPYGRNNARLKGKISKHFNTARGTTWGVNSGKTDVNLLKACKLYGSKDSKNQIKDIINENKKKKSWLIFYTHDVQDSPSDFGCTPDLLKYTINLALESGARLLSIKEAYEIIRKES